MDSRLAFGIRVGLGTHLQASSHVPKPASNAVSSIGIAHCEAGATWGPRLCIVWARMCRLQEELAVWAEEPKS